MVAMMLLGLGSARGVSTRAGWARGRRRRRRRRGARRRFLRQCRHRHRADEQRGSQHRNGTLHILLLFHEVLRLSLLIL